MSFALTSTRDRGENDTEAAVTGGGDGVHVCKLKDHGTKKCSFMEAMGCLFSGGFCLHLHDKCYFATGMG